MKNGIVGSEFTKATANGIKEGSAVTITHDTDNKFDDKALGVYFNSERLGYIGKGTDLYDIDRTGFPKTGKVVDFYKKVEGDKFSRHEEGCIVSVNIEIEDDIKLFSEDNVKSFNEEGVVINFNEQTHTYTYNGKILTGCTTYIKKYVKEFDATAIIPNCEKSWKVPSKTIRNAWELGRDLASTFGISIHKAIEFEDLYGNYTKPKDGSRCFAIKHPAIQNIVAEFFVLYDKLGFQGEVFPEALVSDVENGICGLADRIIVKSREDKVCELFDYKINHSFDVHGEVKFENLPASLLLPETKLSKLALQLNFHQRMLEKQGWTVEGLHGFVYESEWKYYKVKELVGFNILTGKMEYQY